MLRGDVAIIIPARNEAERISATVHAASKLAGADVLVVVDDGSTDNTGTLAAAAGAVVVRHARNRGKAAAMETGAEAVRLIEDGRADAETGEPGDAVARHLLFLDADLADSAARAGPLADPVRSGVADMTIAVFATRVRNGGFGMVVATAGAGIERAIGWRPAQPLNGMRCLTRAAFTAALPLAPGWGVETGLTIDLARKGLRITEVEVDLSHRATGSDWRAQLHRLRQLVDVTRALAAREPAAMRLRGWPRAHRGRAAGRVTDAEAHDGTVGQ
jgi:glycosyltransferase involved in cell wall biosynthesis